jgi:hypothetical protein
MTRAVFFRKVLAALESRAAMFERQPVQTQPEPILGPLMTTSPSTTETVSGSEIAGIDRGLCCRMEVSRAPESKQRMARALSPVAGNRMRRRRG